MEWHHKGPRTVQDLLNLSSKGIRNGYVAPDSFEQICAEADLDTNQEEIKILRDKLSDYRLQIQLYGSAQTTTNGKCVYVCLCPLNCLSLNHSRSQTVHCATSEWCPENKCVISLQ